MAKRRSGSQSGPSSRSRTRQRRQERQQERRRRRQIAAVVVIVVVALVAVVLFAITNRPASAPIPEGTLDRYEGIPQSITDEGFPILGNPDAPVTVEEFSSFSCPGCADFHARGMDTIIEQVREGVISFTYVPMTTGSIPNPEGAARAAICAGQQRAFFEYHDALFEWHRSFGNQAFSQNRLVSGAENLGLNTEQFENCLGTSGPAEIVDDGIAEATARGVNSTPTIMVNGFALPVPDVDQMVQRIESALAASGIAPVPLDQPEETATPEVTEEVTEEATEEPEETPEATQEPQETPESSGD